jgi:uncharacterized protein
MSDIMLPAVDVRPAPASRVTAVGLTIALFSLIILRQIFHSVSPHAGVALTLIREACMFAAAGGLVWLIRRGEKLPLRSVGIGVSPLWKSLAWGVVIAFSCLVPAAVIAKFTGYGHGPAAHTFSGLPAWVICIVVIRAGVVEELFYRGYAIERLQSLGWGRIASWLVPLVLFAAAHWAGGMANMLIAFTLGAILTAFFQWRRDLVSNMFGHFLVDFLANVVPAMLS